MKNIKYIAVLVVIIVFIAGVVYFSKSKVVNQEPVATINTKTGIPTVSLQSIEDGSQESASAILYTTKNVIWLTSNYPSNVGVNINLLKKIYDSPRQFVAVRTIAKNTPNDGRESLILKAEENSSDLYIEVTCSSTYQFNTGCKISGDVLRIN